MKKKKTRESEKNMARRVESLAAETDFYATTPTEKPLYDDHRGASQGRVKKTGRHQDAEGRRKEGPDLREKMALAAILKSTAWILFLLIAFFVLHKSISLFEESRVPDAVEVAHAAPMLEIAPLKNFDIENQEARELFAERVEMWKKSERLVRSADALKSRGNTALAIERCKEALEVDPSHLGALERLGELHQANGSYVEAINAYIRVLGVDPSRADLQERLIHVLSDYDDPPAVVYMARWYMEENLYDPDVQRLLANALFDLEEYEAAVEAYDRVLKDDPNDEMALEQQVLIFMALERYEDALGILDQLYEANFAEISYYQQLAICRAQLGLAQETVQTLGIAAHRFGQSPVIEWIKDPMLDPVREERAFQTFAEGVGGEEFRRYLEKMARTMEGRGKSPIVPQLKDSGPSLQTDLFQKK